jgi:hypothetical protein
MEKPSQEEIKNELNTVISDLKEKGISFKTSEEQVVGLGDIVESTLTKFGITQERFKQFFGLKECNCTERKKYLNNLLSWYVKKKE